MNEFPKNPKSGKRKVRAFSPADSDIESVHMFSPKTKDNSDEDSIYLGLSDRQNLSSLGENPKRQKLSHKTTEVVGQVKGTDENGIIRILLDTGASSTIILRDAIRGLNGPVIKRKNYEVEYRRRTICY